MRERNNFDLVRLFAASQVLVLHAAYLLKVAPAPDTPLGAAFDVLGWFPGVPIFFIVSGFLITDRMLKMFRRETRKP